MSFSPISILLVEDNQEDVELTTELLRDAGYTNRVTSLPDGVTALAYLRRESPYGEEPPPDVVLLDLKLPGRSGHEVLEEMNRDPSLADVAVIVLSTSQLEEDIVRSYEHRVKAFLRKPLDPDEFAAAVRALPGFGVSLVRART